MLRARSDGGQQRHRGSRLAGEMMHPEVRAVDTELIGPFGDGDGIVEHLPGIGITKPAPVTVMTE